MLEVLDRIKQKSTSAGLGNFVLGDVVEGFRPFSEFGTTEFYYCIQCHSMGEWEIGRGKLSGSELERLEILSSSNNNEKVNFSTDDEKLVFNTLPMVPLVENFGET